MNHANLSCSVLYSVFSCDICHSLFCILPVLKAVDTREKRQSQRRGVLQETAMVNHNSLPTHERAPSKGGGKGGKKGSSEAVAKSATSGTMIVKTVAYKAIKEKAAESAKLSKEICNWRTKCNKQEDDNLAQLTTIADLQTDLAIKDKQVEELTKKLAEYTAALAKTGAKAECDLNETLVTHVKSCTKHQLFRTHKFMTDDTDLIAGMQALIAYLPNPLGKISEKEFCRDYKNIVRIGLNEARGYVQSQGAKKVQGAYSIFHVSFRKILTLLAESDLSYSHNIWFLHNFWLRYDRMVADPRQKNHDSRANSGSF